MRQVVPWGAVIGFLGVLGLLVSLQQLAGLGPTGWAVGIACGALLNLLLARGLVDRVQPVLGPADRITLTRAVLACGIAALTVDGFDRPDPVVVLVALAAVALVLDAVDGWVARRTRTASLLGARFDMEADAFLILVLSINVSPRLGWWVLLGGAARYVVVVAAWVAPWLRRPVPARRWRKHVAGLHGVILTVAAAEVLGPNVATGALVVGLSLLALSFGTQVMSLWRLRLPDAERVADPGRWAATGPLAAAPVEGVQCRT